MDSGKEVCCYFVIANCDSRVLLKFAEEFFDQVSGLIGLSVIGTLYFSVAFGGITALLPFYLSRH